MLWAIPVVVVPLTAAAILLFICYSRRLKRQTKGMLNLLECYSIILYSLLLMLFFGGNNTTCMIFLDNNVPQGSRREMQGKKSEFSLFDFEQLLEATRNFSEENILGQGGFGTVYKVN
jgi:hypothetical protein